MADKFNNADESISSPKTQEAVSVLAKIKAKARSLSPEETREILTPFAFKIDQSLLGIPLAVPWRRGIALLIDLLFIALLSDTPGELLAILVAITLFRLGSKKRAAKFGKKPGLRKMALRVIGAFIVFVVLVDTLPNIFSKVDEFNNNVEQAGLSQPIVKHDEKGKQGETSSNDLVKGALTLTSVLAISSSDCAAYDCWQQLLTDLFSVYKQQAPTAAESSQFIASLLENIADKDVLNINEKAQLALTLEQLAMPVQSNTDVTESLITGIPEALDTAEQNKPTGAMSVDEKTENDSTPSPVYKGFAWLQGLIEDLGIGFGWAAFYFTMFTAIWHGQTPGKKLLRIRVLQLDGTPLSIWDSFGRYGGYGAGIATGLLGFAQIYWDPNRQAIHDKISATIVINDTDIARERMAYSGKSAHESNVDAASSSSTES